tara:strand:- start:362 stop:1219 length:858 start_codon:yes stop_codon:yes gene_type:complete
MIIITTDLNPTGDYTRLLNSAIFDDSLTAGEFRLWCRLAALPRGQKLIDLETVNEIAEYCGMDRDTCRDRRRALKDKGYLKIQGQKFTVTVPGEDFKPKKPKLDKNQQLRHDLRDVWNKYKPEAFSKLKNPMAEAQVKTLKLHADHNDAKDLAEFLQKVLKGCLADAWWKDKSLNFTNVFGTGHPKQSKFTNVEKLAKLSTTTKGQAALFDRNGEQCWLDWFASKGHKQFTKVEHLTMERFAAWDHEMDEGSEDILYVYHDEEGNVVHWTYKESQVGVSYFPTAS